MNLESDLEYLPASLPSYPSGPPPLTAAGSCLIGTPTTPESGSIGSDRLRRKWHPFSPALTDLWELLNRVAFERARTKGGRASVSALLVEMIERNRRALELELGKTLR